MTDIGIYSDIANRTGGDIYIGVVGPVRTGKSSLIKRFTEHLILPNIETESMRERAKDEMPQSASGRTVMTTEPKFIPENAVNIPLDEGAGCRIKLIDCVGYVVPGAMGLVEDGQPRMVMTPWSEEPLPFEKAAETGTRRVIDEHSTVGIVVTTDGSIGEIEGNSYVDAERRVVIFLPDYYSYDDVTNDPSLAEITFVFVSANKFDSSKADFSHRDILGSLMGLGIERDSVGDIITNGASAVFLIKTKLAEYVKDNLNKIGKYNVGVTLYDKYDITPKQDFQICLDTVASMRLDAVIASIYKLSRNLSTEYISGGKVYINGVQTTKSDITVKEGDKLTLRGKGKALIDSLDGLSKKGRIRFTYKKYK
jgi:RNA-binding protein YlmH